VQLEKLVHRNHRGGWQETNQSTKVMRGTVLEVLAWLAAEVANAPSPPLSFRALPFELSPIRNVVGLLPVEGEAR
jgi:hypothetical protein